MTLKKILVFLFLSLIVAGASAKPPKPPHDGHAPPPPPPSSPYARIHFDMGHGKPKIDVDCGAQTSIKDCADVVNALLTKAANMPPAHLQPPKPSKPPKP